MMKLTRVKVIAIAYLYRQHGQATHDAVAIQYIQREMHFLTLNSIGHIAHVIQNYRHQTKLESKRGVNIGKEKVVSRHVYLHSTLFKDVRLLKMHEQILRIN